MNQLDAFRLIDEQLTLDFLGGNIGLARIKQLTKAHRVLQKTISKRAIATIKREHEERLMRGDI